jgi:hypothetical protein
MAQLRLATILVCLIGGVSGAFMAYLAATGEAGGPIYSGWQMLYLVLAMVVCAAGVLGGVLVFSYPRWSTALQLLAGLAYFIVVLLMVRRYQANVVGALLLAAGPATVLFLVGGLLAGISFARRDED